MTAAAAAVATRRKKMLKCPWWWGPAPWQDLPADELRQRRLPRGVRAHCVRSLHSRVRKVGKPTPASQVWEVTSLLQRGLAYLLPVLGAGLAQARVAGRHSNQGLCGC